MNYAGFRVWVDERIEELVSFGVPREEAGSMMKWLEVEAIRLETRIRSDRQFVLDFKRLGARKIADRDDVSRQAARQRFVRILESRPSAEVVE